MDMLYHLPFRDWMELDSRPGKAAPEEQPDDPEDSAAIAAARTTAARG
jgi:hypothetical protein